MLTPDLFQRDISIVPVLNPSKIPRRTHLFCVLNLYNAQSVIVRTMIHTSHYDDAAFSYVHAQVSCYRKLTF